MVNPQPCTLSHAIIQQRGTDKPVIVCLTAHAHDAAVIAELLSDDAAECVYQTETLPSPVQITPPSPLAIENRAVAAIMDILGQNSFTSGFAYRLDIQADVLLTLMKQHIAAAVAGQPIHTRLSLLQQSVNQTVTATAFPFAARFVGVLQYAGKPRQNRFRVVDPHNPRNVYLKFCPQDVRSMQTIGDDILIQLNQTA